MKAHGSQVEGHGIQHTRGILDAGGSVIFAVIGIFAIISEGFTFM